MPGPLIRWLSYASRDQYRTVTSLNTSLKCYKLEVLCSLYCLSACIQAEVRDDIVLQAYSV